MKANELMIGDRVFIAGSPTRTIKQLTKHKVGYTANDYDTRVYYTRTEFVFGIPLTPEILEKNGWKTNGHKWWRDDHCLTINGEYFRRKEGIPLDISITDNYTYDLNYVHELQHVLRMCEMNDLADNFKV